MDGTDESRSRSTTPPDSSTCALRFAASLDTAVSAVSCSWSSPSDGSAAVAPLRRFLVGVVAVPRVGSTTCAKKGPGMILRYVKACGKESTTSATIGSTASPAASRSPASAESRNSCSCRLVVQSRENNSGSICVPSARRSTASSCASASPTMRRNSASRASLARTTPSASAAARLVRADRNARPVSFASLRMASTAPARSNTGAGVDEDDVTDDNGNGSPVAGRGADSGGE
mmetsp:Transcript_5545/g.17998  ORF Transcript_5545/g.17998 Transcript_5545/m.17998 type:complete len:232 (+) Transcript_5545:1174-1869(+)